MDDDAAWNAYGEHATTTEEAKVWIARDEVLPNKIYLLWLGVAALGVAPVAIALAWAIHPRSRGGIIRCGAREEIGGTASRRVDRGFTPKRDAATEVDKPVGKRLEFA
jgi:hypothetical protein